MDKKELCEIVKIKKEINRLQNKLKELSYGDNETIVTDKVRGSMAYYPYSARSFTLVGLEQMSEDCIKKRDEIAGKLRAAYSKQLDKINKAIDYINSIPDSEIRTILSYKYIDGLTEENISEMMGISDRTVRRKLKFWAENNKQIAQVS